jgi:hypothetical protein
MGARASHLAAALALMSGCSDNVSPPKLPPDPSGPGLTFAWPRDGQRDVPVRSPVVLHFSDPLSGTPAIDCAVFCVEGPSGPVAGQVTVAPTDTLVFTPAVPFAEGTSYKVHARSGLLSGETNLDGDPLLSFTTRITHPVPGAAATLVALGDGPPDGGALPFIDAAPLRLMFSEPVDPNSVTAASVTLSSADGGPVPAHLSAGGVHVVVDPLTDLTPGVSWTLTWRGLRDLGGEPIPNGSVTVVPQRSAPPEGVIVQRLALAPAWTGSATATSSLSGWPVNASVSDSPLIGSATLGLVAGGLEAELGAPDAFGGPIPMVLRRGQTLDLSPLAIRFGGAFESGYQTATLHFTVLNDVVGWLTRSPFRPGTQLPDDRSPVFVDLTMDTVVTADDAQGNAMATQTLMGLRLLGLSRIDDDQLAVDQVGAGELGTLGINVAATTLALRLRTGAMPAAPAERAPRLFSTLPAKAAAEADPDGKIELVFTAPVSATAATVKVTENAAAVAATWRVEGSTLIIVPSRRFADAARVVVTWSGLTTPRGASVMPSPDDALMGQASLFFNVAPLSATTAPPKLASVTIGAPCALVGTSATSGGSCAGGKPDDNPYVAFSLPAEREISVGFTQPMRASSLTLGTACGSGAVRVERLDAAGACSAVVRGTLKVSDRGFQFVPASPWVEGTKYRLVMVAGNGAACVAGGICSAAGVALDSDPLSGTAAGGPDVVIGFTGAKASPDSVQMLASAPYADLNDNGVVDPEEVFHDENRVAMEIVGTSGIVSSASLNGTDCVPSRAGQQVCTSLRGELPVVVGKLETNCPLSTNGTVGQGSGPCLQVRVLPNVLLNTSMSMNTTVVGILPMNNLPTHELIMRIREPGGPAYGYIMRDPAAATPVFVIRQSVYLDAPDLSIAGGLASHDLNSKPLDVVLKGPVTFLPDGRMDVALANLDDVPLSVNIKALGLGGTINMRIPKGEMHLTLVGAPLR